jgi:hypothetical protein
MNYKVNKGVGKRGIFLLNSSPVSDVRDRMDVLSIRIGGRKL